jgi:hypothetical protein
MSNNRTFEGELSVQRSLSDHLIRRALEAHEAGDADVFKYASEIYEETQQRIGSVAAASRSIENAYAKHNIYRSLDDPKDFEVFDVERSPQKICLERVLGATAIGAMVLSNDLRSIEV